MTVWDPKFIPEVLLPRVRLSATASRLSSPTTNSSASTLVARPFPAEITPIRALPKPGARKTNVLRKGTLDVHPDLPESKRKEFDFSNSVCSRTNDESSSVGYYEYLQVNPIKDGSLHKFVWELDFLATSLSFMLGIQDLVIMPLRCAQFGGIAYLIARLIAFATVGLPCLLLEQFVGHFTLMGPLQALGHLLPLCAGVGFAMVLFCIILALTDAAYVIWSLSYLASLLTIPNAVLNSAQQATLNGSGANFFRDHVLNASSAVNELGDLQCWPVVGLGIAWITAFLVAVMGLSFIARVCYVTSLGPFVLLCTLMCYTIWRNAAGAGEGVQQLLQAEWIQLLHFQTWTTAFTDVITSMRFGFGILLLLSSLNRKPNKLLRSTLIVGILHFTFGLLCVLVVACLIGSWLPTMENAPTMKEFLSHASETNLFHAISLPLMWKVEYLPWFAVLLITILLLSIDTLVLTLETIATSLGARRWRPVVLIASSALLFLASLPLATQGGVQVLQLLNGPVLEWPQFYLTMGALLACFAGLGVRSIESIARTLSDSPGLVLQGYLVVLYTFVVPISLTICLVYSIVSYASVIEKYHAWWSPAIVGSIAGLPMCIIITAPLGIVLCCNAGLPWAKRLSGLFKNSKSQPTEFHNSGREEQLGQASTMALSSSDLCCSRLPYLHDDGDLELPERAYVENPDRLASSSDCPRTFYAFTNPTLPLED